MCLCVAIQYLLSQAYGQQDRILGGVVEPIERVPTPTLKARESIWSGSINTTSRRINVAAKSDTLPLSPPASPVFSRPDSPLDDQLSRTGNLKRSDSRFGSPGTGSRLPGFRGMFFPDIEINGTAMPKQPEVRGTMSFLQLLLLCQNRLVIPQMILPAGLEEIFRRVNFMDGFHSSIQVSMER